LASSPPYAILKTKTLLLHQSSDVDTTI